VEAWKRENMPHLKRGIPLFDAFRWWRAERFRELDELRETRTRREVAKARHQELVTAEKEKSLVPADTAVIWLCRGVSDARLGFMGLPRRLASTIFLLVQKALQEAVSKVENPEIREAVNKLIPGLKFDEKDVEFALHKEIRLILTELAKPLKGGKHEKK